MGGDPARYPARARSLGEGEARSLDAVAKLHSLAVERYAERRRLEWRVSLTIWAGLVVAANALVEAGLGDPWVSWRWWAVAVGLVVIVAAHGAWEWWAISKAATDDRRDGYRLDALQRRTLGLPRSVKAADDDGTPKKDPPNWFVSHGWQVFITAALALFVSVVAL